MKKIFILIVCFCQTDSIYAMRRNTNNPTPTSTTHTVEDDAIVQHKKLLQDAKKRKFILIEQNKNNNADFNDANNDNEGDFITLIHRPQKKEEVSKNNDAFSKLVRKENRKLKKANKRIYQHNPNYLFFSPCEQDDFSELSFFKPGQANHELINHKNNQILDEDESGSSSEGEIDDYDFPELKSLEYQLKLLEDSDDVALESPLIDEDDRREDLLEALNNLPDETLMDIVDDLRRSYMEESTE